MNKTSTTATYDDDRPITQADIDSGRLPARKRAPDGHIVQTKRQG